MGALRKAGVWLGLVEEDDERGYDDGGYDKGGYRDSRYRQSRYAEEFADDDEDDARGAAGAAAARRRPRSADRAVEPPRAATAPRPSGPSVGAHRAVGAGQRPVDHPVRRRRDAPAR